MEGQGQRVEELPDDDFTAVEEVQGTTNKDQARAAKGVDSVTDFVQEKGAADTGKLQAAIGSIGAVKGAAVAAAVVLNESEVKVLMDECEITKEAAEQLLRKNGNELRTAMLAFARGQ